MKRTFILAIALTVWALCLSASGFEAGMRNTRYIFGSYSMSNGLRFEINHSLFSEKLGYQAVGARIGYTRSSGIFSYGAHADASTAWNGSYRIVGATIHGMIAPGKIFFAEAALNPHYDSGYGYNTCFKIGVGANITRQISIMAAYTTIPEYRKSDKRLRGGFGFKVKNLYVQPNLSVPVQGESKLKNIRVLFDFSYKF